MPSNMIFNPGEKKMICYKGTTLADQKAIFESWKGMGKGQDELWDYHIAAIEEAIEESLPACGYEGNRCGEVVCPLYGTIQWDFGEFFDTLNTGNINGQGTYEYCEPWGNYSGPNCSAEVIVKEGEDKMLRLTDNNTSECARARLSLKSGYQMKDGQIRFIVRSSANDKECLVYLFKGSTLRIYFKLGNNGKMSFVGMNDFMDYEEETWYKIKIKLSFMEQKLELYVDDHFIGQTTLGPYNDYVDSIRFWTGISDPDDYVDYMFDIDKVWGTFILID